VATVAAPRTAQTDIFLDQETGLMVSLWWGGVPLKNKRISAEKIFLIKGGLW